MSAPPPIVPPYFSPQIISCFFIRYIDKVTLSEESEEVIRSLDRPEPHPFTVPELSAPLLVMLLIHAVNCFLFIWELIAAARGKSLGQGLRNVDKKPKNHPLLLATSLKKDELEPKIKIHTIQK